MFTLGVPSPLARLSNIENAHRPVYAAAPGGVISSAPVTFFNLDTTLSPGLDSQSREKIDVRRTQIEIFKSLGTIGGGVGGGARDERRARNLWISD